MSLLAPNVVRFHWSESGVPCVYGFVPWAPPAHARFTERRHTVRSACAVMLGCTMYQLRPASCVPRITPPSPTAQPLSESLNETLRSVCAVGLERVQNCPPSDVRTIVPFAPTAQPRDVSAKHTP